MKKRFNKESCTLLCQKTYNEISIIKSVISSVQECNLNLELQSQYYDKHSITAKLSEERNRSINLLSIVLERLQKLETINNDLEDYLV